MAKFYVFIKNDKSSYDTPQDYINENYDKDLKLEFANTFGKVGFESVKEAELEVRNALKKLWIYDHTKRPNLATDFKKYSYWICNGEVSIKITNNIGEKFNNLEECYDSDNSFCAPIEYALFKPAIVKRGSCDFSKEKDPSNGKFAAQAKKIHDREAELNELWKMSFDRVVNEYIDGNRCTSFEAPDSLTKNCDTIENFWKDELHLPEKINFIVPANGYDFFEYEDIVKNDPSSKIGHRRGFALITAKINFAPRFWNDKQPSAFYKTSIKLFPSKEQASLYASLNSLEEPKVFKIKELPGAYSVLYARGSLKMASTIYRYMVHEGMLEANPKFIKK